MVTFTNFEINFRSIGRSITAIKIQTIINVPMKNESFSVKNNTRSEREWGF